jgi:hypothetical protein
MRTRTLALNRRKEEANMKEVFFNFSATATTVKGWK